jgi:hypothetical protein
VTQIDLGRGCAERPAFGQVAAVARTPNDAVVAGFAQELVVPGRVVEIVAGRQLAIAGLSCSKQPLSQFFENLPRHGRASAVNRI